jgi:hypothetical protein
MNPDDSFYQFARRPDLSEPSQSFTFRTRDAEAGGGGGGSARAATSKLPWSLRAVTAGSPPATTYTIDSAKVVTNLLTNAGPTVTGLTGIVLAANTKVWLSISFSSGNPSGWEVTTTNPAGSHVTFGGEPNYYQTSAHYLLGQVLSGNNANLPGFDFSIGASNYHYEQLATTRLTSTTMIVNGQIAVYPSAL